MENVRNFFNEVVEFEIEEVKKGNLHINHGFPQIGNFDFQRLCAHIDKIANKLLSMQKEEREVYAKWLVETIIDRYKVVALYDVENVKVKSSGVIKYRDEKEPINEALEYIITPIPFRKIEIIGRCDNVECDIELIQSDIDMFVKSVFSILVEKPRDFDPLGQTGFAHLWLQYD